MSICALIGLNTMTPNAASWMTGRDLARALNAAGALPPHVSIVDERIGSVVFYLAPALRTRLTATTIRSDQFAEAIQHIRVDPAESLVAVRNDQRDEFARYFSSPPAPEAVAGTFTLYRTGDVRAALQVP